MATIHILVTPERFDEIFSIEDWLNFGKLTNKAAYEYMLQFVVDDEGKPLPEAQARKLFKGVPAKDWTKYLNQFVQAVEDAFVNPTSGSSSGRPVSEPPAPAG